MQLLEVIAPHSGCPRLSLARALIFDYYFYLMELHINLWSLLLSPW